MSVRVICTSISVLSRNEKKMHCAEILKDCINLQGYLREGKCHMCMGNGLAAVHSYKKALELEKNNNQARAEVGAGMIH